MSLEPLTDPNGGRHWPQMSAQEIAELNAQKRRRDDEVLRARLEEHRLSRLRTELGERWAERTFATFSRNAGNSAALDRALAVVGSGFALGAGFVGAEGNGKTHLAAAIVHTAITSGKSARFVTFQNFLRRLYAAEKAGNYRDVLWSYTGADVLVLDDVGKEDQTPWDLPKKFAAVNDLYETGRRLIVTANMPLASLIAFYGAVGQQRADVDSTSGASLIARIVEMVGGVDAFVSNTAPSQRWSA